MEQKLNAASDICNAPKNTWWQISVILTWLQMSVAAPLAATKGDWSPTTTQGDWSVA